MIQNHMHDFEEKENMTMKRKITVLMIAFTMLCSTLGFGWEEVSASVNNPIREDLNYESGEYWSDVLFYNGDGVKKSYLVATDKGYSRIKIDDRGAIVINYSRDFTRKTSKTLPKELTWAKGFYEGQDYFYLFYSAENPKESDSKEVFRIVQYDKNWNRLRACSLYGQNSVSICQYGLEAAECGGYLYVYTDHVMYKFADGINHEENKLFQVKISDMSLVDSSIGITCSHSFGEHITIDDKGNVILLNKGDYSGAVEMVSYGNALKENSPCGIDETLIDNPYTHGDGTWGFENYVYLGGVDYSDSSYLATGTSLALDANWDNNEVSNVFITVTPRREPEEESESSKLFWLTKYKEGSKTSAGKPYIAKLESNKFLILWSQVKTRKDARFSYSTGKKNLIYDCDDFTELGKLSYVIVDGEGNVLEPEREIPGYLSDCKPIVEGKNLVWFYTPYGGPTVFCELNTLAGTIKKHTREIKIDISKYKVADIVDGDYTGKAIKQIPFIYSGKWDSLMGQYENELRKGKDYTITYKNNVAVGTATMIIKGIGEYKGTITKTFKIFPLDTSIVSLKKGKKAFTVKWKKRAKQTTGYQIQYSRSKYFKKAKTLTVKKNTITSKTIKKLKKKTKYYVHVRTYKKVGGKVYYSDWSKRKSIKTK